MKDAFHGYVIHGKTAAVNPGGFGTKAAAHYVLDVPAEARLSCSGRGLPPTWTTSRPSFPEYADDTIAEHAFGRRKHSTPFGDRRRKPRKKLP